MDQAVKSEQSIFLAALEIESSDDRSAFLNAECGANQELRASIRALLDVHAKSGDILDELDSTGPEAVNSGVPPLVDGVLGDFRILREVGRGGMGVVYDAEQISLKRRVALKVLPFAAVLDKRQLQRFRTEAMAAARLHHPHIVPVFQVGCERAVHYYAMQYVEGRNVSELLDAIRLHSRARQEAADERPIDPSAALIPSAATTLKPALFSTAAVHNLSNDYSTNKHKYHQTIAKLGIQAAEALDFAHKHGILHRDVKPSNLMLDDEGCLWVTDFGLARIEGDSGLTMSGDLVGTLRYMSPEQVLGKRVLVDERTDVYSLGVTLYEMLTLHPAYAGADRGDLLRRISFEEPIRPRKIDPTIPADLETILLTATAHDARCRYETTREFAEDLQRFLDHKPILAKRPSRIEWARKWINRNRSLSAALALVLLAVILASASAIAVLSRQDASPKPFREALARPAVAINTAAPLQMAAGTGHLFGLIPNPPDIPGIGRWQLITRAPRSFAEENWSLAWSPDSRFLCFGDGENVSVYSVPDFQLVQMFCGHTGSVVAVDWSPDGEMIASASADNTVRLWNVATGTPGPVLVGHRGRVNAIAWHPDSQRLASGSRDNNVRLWTRTGEAGPVLTGHAAHVMSVAWSSDGTKLASTGGHTIILWPGDGTKGFILDAKFQLGTIAWSPDGRRLLVSQHLPRIAQIWGLDGIPEVTLEGHRSAVVSAAWRPDGEAIATASWDNTVRVWWADGTAGPVLTDHDGDVACARWSPDGKWLASGGTDRTIRLWSADGAPGPALQGSRPVSSVSWHPNGEEFAAAVHDHSIRLCTKVGIQKRVLEGHRGPVNDVAWNPDGQRIVSCDQLGTVRVWNVDQETTFAELPAHPTEALCVAWNRTGTRFASGSGQDPAIRIWNEDGTAGPVLEGHEHPKVYEVVWNPVADQLASVCVDGTLRLWNPNGETAQVMDGGVLLAAVVWLPDGRQLACGCNDGTIQLWHVNNRLGRLMPGHADRVTSLDLSGDGEWIASGSRDSTIRVWSAEGAPLVTFWGHNQTVNSVRWRPGTHQLLSAAQDATVRLWDAETGRAVWVAVVLPNNEIILLGPAGELLGGDPRLFEREFAFVVERPDGAMEILTPTEFQQQRATK